MKLRMFGLTAVLAVIVFVLACAFRSRSLTLAEAVDAIDKTQATMTLTYVPETPSVAPYWHADLAGIGDDSGVSAEEAIRLVAAQIP